MCLVGGLRRGTDVAPGGLMNTGKIGCLARCRPSLSLTEGQGPGSSPSDWWIADRRRGDGAPAG